MSKRSRETQADISTSNGARCSGSVEIYRRVAGPCGVRKGRRGWGWRACEGPAVAGPLLSCPVVWLVDPLGGRCDRGGDAERPVVPHPPLRIWLIAAPAATVPAETTTTRAPTRAARATPTLASALSPPRHRHPEPIKPPPTRLCLTRTRRSAMGQRLPGPHGHRESHWRPRSTPGRAGSPARPRSERSGPARPTREP